MYQVKRSLFSYLEKFFTLGILLVSLLLVHPDLAFAHRPHDVIASFAVSPTYSQDKTLFIIVRGMPMKSIDGGKNWQRISYGLDYRADPNSLAISSQKSSIIYLSTPLDGVYKSEDGGSTWFKVNQGIDNLKITGLVVSPHSDDVILAAADEHKLYYTDSGGKSWKPILNVPTKVTAMSFSPANPHDILAGDSQGNIYFSQTGGKDWQTITSKIKDGEPITSIALAPDKTWFIGTSTQGIFESTDEGLTIKEVNSGITDKNIRDIAISPNYSQDNNVIISTWQEGTFLSNDQGKTWQKSNKGLTKTSQADEEQFLAPHFTYLRLNSNFANDKTIYLGGFNGLFESTDGGKNWEEVYTLSIRYLTALAISPNYAKDKTLAVGTYEGEAYLTQDEGKSWKSIVNGLSVVKFRSYKNTRHFEVDNPRFFDIHFSPNYSSDNTLFAALIYKFTKSTNKGAFWNEIRLPSADSWRDMFIAPSPNIAKDKVVYLAAKYGGGIYRSNNNGDKFSKVGSVAKNIASLEISPNFAEDKTLYATTFVGVEKSVDGGATWSSITNTEALKYDDLAWRFLAISPNYKSDKTIVAGTKKGILKSTDAGETWIYLAKNKREEYLIDTISFSPNYTKDQTFIGSARGIGLVKTTDGGKNFLEIGKDFMQKGFPWVAVISTSKPLQFSPNYAVDQTLYGFGTNNTDIYQSTDGGNTWKVINIDKQYNANADLTVKVKKTRILLRIYPFIKFIIAALIALLTYWLVGYLGIDRLLPLNRLQIRIICTIIMSILVLVGLSALI